MFHFEISREIIIITKPFIIFSMIHMKIMQISLRGMEHTVGRFKCNFTFLKVFNKSFKNFTSFT